MRNKTSIAAIVLCLHGFCLAYEATICGYTVPYSIRKTESGQRPSVGSISPTDNPQPVFVWPSHLGEYPANEWWTASGLVGENFVNCNAIEEFQVQQRGDIWASGGCLIYHKRYASGEYGPETLLAYPSAKRIAIVPDEVCAIRKSFASTNLEEIILPASIQTFSVANIKTLCPKLKTIWMLGNAPQNIGTDFSDMPDLKIYVEGGTTGWPKEGCVTDWDKYSMVKPSKHIESPLVVEDTLGITNITEYSMKYDGKFHQPKLEVISPADGIVRYSFNADGPFEFTPPIFKNVCSTTVWYVVSCKEYFPVTNKFSVCITPRKLYLESRSKSKPYDGTPLSGNEDDIIVLGDGLVDGETFEYNDFVSVIGPTSEEGVLSTFTYKETGATDASNYAITASYGRLYVLKVATPVITPVSESFAPVSQEITLSCATDGAVIYYTIDGSEPSAMNGREYKGPFDIYETVTVKAIAVKDDWKDSAVASATFTRTDAIGPAIDFLEVLPDNDKTHPWTVVTDVTHDGVSAVKSGDIEDEESTTLKVVVYGAGQLSFWWRTSCEPCIDGEYYDFATFYNGSTEVAKLAGVTDWQRVTLDVAGTGKHTFKWTYQKDDSGSMAPDGMWLDQVQWLGATTDYYADHTLTTDTPVPYKWLMGYGFGTATGFETAANMKTGKRDAFGRELTVEADYVAGTDPTNATSQLRSYIAVTNGVAHVTWEPNHVGEREYKIWGKESLDDAKWQCPTNAQHRFFKVTVGLP